MFFLTMYVVLFLLKKWVSPQRPVDGIEDWDHEVIQRVFLRLSFREDFFHDVSGQIHIADIYHFLLGNGARIASMDAREVLCHPCSITR